MLKTLLKHFDLNNFSTLSIL